MGMFFGSWRRGRLSGFARSGRLWDRRLRFQSESKGTGRNGLNPCVGHDLKIGLPFADFYLANGWFLGHDQSRLAKRRRALLESNSPRNSQLETHRNDEVAGAVWIRGRLSPVGYTIGAQRWGQGRRLDCCKPVPDTRRRRRTRMQPEPGWKPPAHPWEQTPDCRRRPQQTA
jgi:hypothetical protein